MKLRGQWLVVGVLLLVCASGYAQTTGSIHGQANDHEGKALPGVTVKLTGDRIPGDERATVSDAQGNFKYGALPVGNYSLAASLAGFKSEEVTGVRVTIDGVASVTFRLQPEAFAGEIFVTTETPLVDPASTSVSTNFSAEFIEALPTRNNFFDIMSVAPAMSQPNEGSAYFSGYGGNVTSRQWNIDGLNLASPEGGLAELEHQPRHRARDLAQGLRRRGGVRQHVGQRLQRGHEVRDQPVPRGHHGLSAERQLRRPERHAESRGPLRLPVVGPGG